MSFADSAAETMSQRTMRMHFASCVEELFDDYAHQFETSLAGLGYASPSMIEAALLRDCADASGCLSSSLAVDLGCGTGLAGERLTSHCSGRLVGCDLSRRMLKLAARKNLYEQLVACDCVAYLHKQVPAASADLVVAADVCVYMRSLTPLFRAVADALRVGGAFAFTVEKGEASECAPGEGWVERPSERIAHCEEYLRWLVAQPEGGLELRRLDEIFLRRDGKQNLRGYLGIVVKGGSAGSSEGGGRRRARVSFGGGGLEYPAQPAPERRGRFMLPGGREAFPPGWDYQPDVVDDEEDEEDAGRGEQGGVRE